ncbi:MAG: VWA domain-containing protein [Candidatus Peribacteria bacterium]|nr:VWA domain-containing protein [Candidatus Peribacteria bacterium]
MIALDISTSMEATDLEPNRIESAKKIISEFIEKQETNRV